MAIEQRVMDGGHADEDAQRAEVDRAEEHERQQLEDSLRRLAQTLHGALTHKRRESRPRAHRPGPHDAAQHALRRHPVPARSRSSAPRTSRGW